MAFVDEAAIEVGVVYFGYEDDALMFRLDLAYGPCPKGAWHHLCHVATEAVDAACSPKAQDVEHLVPGGWYGVAVAAEPGVLWVAAAEVVDAVVELDGFVPVVDGRGRGEAVVAGGASRGFVVGLTIWALAGGAWSCAWGGQAVNAAVRAAALA